MLLIGTSTMGGHLTRSHDTEAAEEINRSGSGK